MKKLLLGVMLVGMVFTVSSCKTREMDDDTFTAITQTWLANTTAAALESALDPEHTSYTTTSEAERKEKFEKELAEACKEHGWTLSDYKRKAKTLSPGKKLRALIGY